MVKIHQHTERFNFQVRDEKGREIGAEINTWTAMVGEGELFGVAAGKWFAANFRATRNEVKFGAAQYSRYFATQEERASAITKYLADAGLRAQKKLTEKTRKLVAKTQQVLNG